MTVLVALASQSLASKKSTQKSISREPNAQNLSKNLSFSMKMAILLKIKGMRKAVKAKRKRRTLQLVAILVDHHLISSQQRKLRKNAVANLSLSTFSNSKNKSGLLKSRPNLESKNCKTWKMKKRLSSAPMSTRLIHYSLA